MDSFELNKIAGAVLFTCLVVLGLSIVSEELFTAPSPAQPGYEVAIAEEVSGEVAAEAEGPDLGTLLAAADPAAGEGAVRPCVACHTFEQGGEARVGPNLYNVVGGPKAHVPSFNYSAAMQEAAAAGETWGYEELDAFLANPRGYMPGTTMAFAGVRDHETRADIVMYLASLTESPPPLPEPQAAAEDGAEAAPEDTAEPADAAVTERAEPAPLDHPERQPAADEPTPQEDAIAQPQNGQQPAAEATVEQQQQPQQQTPAQEQPAADAPAQEDTSATPAEGQAVAQEGEASALHQLIAAADPGAGQSAARPCMACHTFEEGGANRVGPNLYDVVGNEKAHRDDYSYSAAMQEAAAAGGMWNYEELDAFLASPRDYLPGTTMAFAGIRDEERRAALISYMRGLSDNPPPIPGTE